MTLRILVDADACPVKEEIYRVAYRHEVSVVIVANSYFRVPDHPLVSKQVVSDGFDAADDWIAETANPRSIVITADILLADRALKVGATVIGNNGRPFTAGSIGGPAPFSKADRSRFLQELDAALVRLKRG
jgi:uncharacterized protein